MYNPIQMDFVVLLPSLVRTLHTAVTSWIKDRLEHPSHGAMEEIPQVRFYILHLYICVCVCHLPIKTQNHKGLSCFSSDSSDLMHCLFVLDFN